MMGLSDGHSDNRELFSYDLLSHISVLTLFSSNVRQSLEKTILHN